MIFAQVIMDAIETTSFASWLLNQAPVTVVLGVVIYWLAKKYEDVQNKKDSLADAVVKITLLWEERYSKESSDQREIREFMKEIREILQDIKDGN